MSYEIKYRSKWNGNQQTHKYEGHEAGARGWAKILSKDNGCKATAERVERDGSRTHIVSEGHDK